MSRSGPVHVLALALLAALALAPRAAGALTLDPLTTALPPNPQLPATAPTLLFVGSYCDGASCPPGTEVTQVHDQALQAGVPGVPDGSRLATLDLQFDGLVAQIDPAARRLVVTPPFDGEGYAMLRYGTAGALHLNLLADGAGAFVFDVDSAAPALLHYVAFSVQVTSHWGEPGEASAIWTESVAAPGTLRFDFASFPGIDFTQVDEISFIFRELLLGGIPFSVGPLATDGGATPVRARSWGDLKTRYR